MRSALLLVAGFVALLWAVELANGLANHRLNDYGIVPRTINGLIGIPLAPLLHGGFGHLFSNSVPLLVLGGLTAAQGRKALLNASLFIVLLGGAGVWLAGRSSVHVGASGLVFGLFGYLVARGWYQRSIGAVLIAVVVLGALLGPAVRRAALRGLHILGGAPLRTVGRGVGGQARQTEASVEAPALLFKPPRLSPAPCHRNWGFISRGTFGAMGASTIHRRHPWIRSQGVSVR